MTCFMARNSLSELLDEAVDPVRRAELTRHIDGCRECARELEALRAVRGMLRALPVHRAPVDLLARVREKAERRSWLQWLQEGLVAATRIPRPVAAGVVFASTVLIAGVWMYRNDRADLFALDGAPGRRTADVIIEDSLDAGAQASTVVEEPPPPPSALAPPAEPEATAADRVFGGAGGLGATTEREARFESGPADEERDKANRPPPVAKARPQIVAIPERSARASPPPSSVVVAEPAFGKASDEPDGVPRRAAAPRAPPPPEPIVNFAPPPASTFVEESSLEAEMAPSLDSIGSDASYSAEPSLEPPPAAPAPAAKDVRAEKKKDAGGSRRGRAAAASDEWGGGGPASEAGGDWSQTGSAPSGGGAASTVDRESSKEEAAAVQITFRRASAIAPAEAIEAVRAAGGTVVAPVGNVPSLSKVGSSTTVVAEIDGDHVDDLLARLRALGTVERRGSAVDGRVRVRITVTRR